MIYRSVWIALLLQAMLTSYYFNKLLSLPIVGVGTIYLIDACFKSRPCTSYMKTNVSSWARFSARYKIFKNIWMKKVFLVSTARAFLVFWIKKELIIFLITLFSTEYHHHKRKWNGKRVLRNGFCTFTLVVFCSTRCVQLVPNKTLKTA